MKKLPADLTEKLCKYCSAVKPIALFPKPQSGRCRACHAIETKRWYEANKDRHKTMRDDWRKENAEVNAAYNKAYRDNHKPEMAAYQKHRAIDDPIGDIAHRVITTAKQRQKLTRLEINEQRKYGSKEAAKRRNAKYLSNPENSQAQASLGSARLRATVNLKPSDIRKLWNDQKGLCALSGLPMVRGKGRGNHHAFSPSLDRIDPTGNYELGNVRFLCFAVNSGRGRQTDEQFITMCRAIVDLADNKSLNP